MQDDGFVSKDESFMRLDKYLAQLNIGTRSQVKELIRKKKVSVNQLIITNPD